MGNVVKLHDTYGDASKSARYTRIHTRAQDGIETPAVTIEAHRPGGAPGFSLVGMPQTAVREARDRVKSALKTTRLEFPRGQLVVNLAPADLAKLGGRYDLAIAMSILAETNQVPNRHLETSNSSVNCRFTAKCGASGAVSERRSRPSTPGAGLYFPRPTQPN